MAPGAGNRGPRCSSERCAPVSDLRFCRHAGQRSRPDPRSPAGISGVTDPGTPESPPHTVADGAADGETGRFGRVKWADFAEPPAAATGCRASRTYMEIQQSLTGCPRRPMSAKVWRSSSRGIAAITADRCSEPPARGPADPAPALGFQPQHKAAVPAHCPRGADGSPGRR